MILLVKTMPDFCDTVKYQVDRLALLAILYACLLSGQTHIQ